MSVAVSLEQQVGLQRKKDSMAPIHIHMRHTRRPNTDTVDSTRRSIHTG
jgi:hypothetical protein